MSLKSKEIDNSIFYVSYTCPFPSVEILALFICTDYHLIWGSHQMSVRIKLSLRSHNLFNSKVGGLEVDRKVRNFLGFSKSLQLLLVI